MNVISYASTHARRTRHLMKTIALLARKGGAGKTTVAIHAGVLAQEAGMRVLFLDLDPQRSLSAWWNNRAAETPGLIETDARQLKSRLELAQANSYDLAVIDTPPAITFETSTVAVLADLALIPLRPSVLDLLAVSSTADVVRASKTPGLLVLNACPAPRGSSEAMTTLEARTALSSAGIPVAATSLTQRIDYTRALNGGRL